MMTRKRWSVALVLPAVLFAIALVRTQNPGLVSAANGFGPSSDTDCSISTMAAEYEFSIQSTTGPSIPAVLDKTLAEVQRVEPGAVVAERMSGALRSSQLPTIDGRTAIVLRLDGLAPRSASGPAPAEGESSDGVARPQVAVKCAVALFDAGTGEFLVSMIDMVAPTQ